MDHPAQALVTPDAALTRSGSVGGSASQARAGRPQSRSSHLPRLGPRQIGAAVRQHLAAFTACHTLADNDIRRRDGAVTVGWLVEADGGDAQVKIGRSSFDDPQVNGCVLSVARRVTFPASATASEVAWTVHFRGDTSGPVAEAGSRFASERPAR